MVQLVMLVHLSHHLLQEHLDLQDQQVQLELLVQVNHLHQVVLQDLLVLQEQQVMLVHPI